MAKNLYSAFKSLDTQKWMRFNNKEELISYEQAIKIFLGSDQEKSLKLLSKSISSYCQSTGNNDMSAKDLNSSKVVKVFHNWMCSIHNDHLIPLEGQTYPNNLIRDLLTYSKQHLSELSEPEILLCFMLDGANGRKIYHGTNPEFTWHSGKLLDWNGSPMDPYSMIDTTLSVKVSAAIKSLNIANTNTEKFYSKYVGYVEKFSDQHSNFKSRFEDLKGNDTFLGALSFERGLELNKVVNPQTGANSYSYDENLLLQSVAILNNKNLDSIQVLSQINGVIKFLQEQAEEFTKLIPNIAKQEKLQTDEALLLWDLSEYVEKMILALKIAVMYVGVEDNRLSELLEVPFIREIMQRNSIGDYPGKERNDDLKNTKQVSELYLQEEAHLLGDLNCPLDTFYLGSGSEMFDVD
jgi:hypothetical protein